MDDMRTILLVLLLIGGFWACTDDESYFDVEMPRENISFRPISGGAVMYYTLPQDKGIESIIVRYKDAFGKNIVRSGSYVSDTLMLVGFNEAIKGVKAQVTLCNRNNVESEPIEVTFDTENSGAVAFFEQLEVKPSWNGFMLTYNVPENANGMAHVFYVWKNPTTGESDTLLMSSFAIVGGADTLAFPLKNSGKTNDVVVHCSTASCSVSSTPSEYLCIRAMVCRRDYGFDLVGCRPEKTSTTCKTYIVLFS